MWGKRIRASGALLLLIISVPSVIAAAGSARTVHLDDDSDWWSILNPNFIPWKFSPQNREVSSSNFSVKNVALQKDMFKRAEAGFGESTRVTRGDAASGRDQVCYSFSENAQSAYLVFEQGEVSYTFYLFRDGPRWSGRDLCPKSSLVGPVPGTSSGLYLGQPRAQVESILGKPSATFPDRTLYFLVTKRESAAKTSRQPSADIASQPADRMADIFYLSVRIEVRFMDSKLNYLMVSKAETD
jgi:hypothetical protein